MSKQTIIKANPSDLVSIQEENLSRALTLEQRAEEVKQRAVDLFDNGQTQPVRCYPGKGGKPHVYIGHTRVAAGKLLREGFQVPTGETETVPGEKEGETVERPVFRTVHNPDFQVEYVLDDISADEAVIRGLSDNFQNFKPNDLDLARAAKALQEKYPDMTDKRVTEILAVSDPFKIGRVKKLLNLPVVVQEAVQHGNLATVAALEIVEAEGDARRAAVNLVKEAAKAEAAGETAKYPTQGQVKAAIREASGITTTTTNNGPGGNQIRTDFQVLESEIKDDATVPDEYKEFLGETLRYLTGRITFKTWQKKVEPHFGIVKKAPVKRQTRKATEESKEEAGVAE